MEKIHLKVEGMTCGGCVQSIQKALTGRDGVRTANADLDTGMVMIEYDEKAIRKSGLEKAIVDAGFSVGA
jgi:copper chaperone